MLLHHFQLFNLRRLLSGGRHGRDIGVIRPDNGLGIDDDIIGRGNGGEGVDGVGPRTRRRPCLDQGPSLPAVRFR